MLVLCVDPVLFPFFPPFWAFGHFGSVWVGTPFPPPQTCREMDIRSFFKATGPSRSAAKKASDGEGSKSAPKRKRAEAVAPAKQAAAAKSRTKKAKAEPSSPVILTKKVYDVDENLVIEDSPRAKAKGAKKESDASGAVQPTPSRKRKTASPKSDKKEASPKKRRSPGSASKKDAKKDVDTFVFTGVLTRPDSADVLPREEAVEMVVEVGGRCTSAVSSKTTYLVTGDELEDGRPFTEGKKYKKAVTLSTCKIMKAEDFFAYIEEKRKHMGPSADDAVTFVAKPVDAGGSQKVVTPGRKNAEPSASGQKVSPPSPSGKVADEDGALWVDKYMPQTIGDLVGNRKVLNDLGNWLQSWHAIHVTEEKPKPRSKQNPGAKAALLSGPPGIGKSTMARLVARACGYTIYELNASDKRSKRLLHEALRDALHSTMIQVHTDGSTGLQRRCVVMDEVTGVLPAVRIAAGTDRTDAFLS
eukprot:scaffold1474_cov256-Pinguiococcus_pyrenoidosus.AAC.12